MGAVWQTITSGDGLVKVPLVFIKITTALESFHPQFPSIYLLGMPSAAAAAALMVMIQGELASRH